jgi:hypothetical protein
MTTARHPKATFFVQRHLFSGLTSFAELEQKIAALPDEQSRGAAFEVFAEALLSSKKFMVTATCHKNQARISDLENG